VNPRKTFDEGSLQELSVSIEKQGLLQPILVRPIDWYDELVNGAIESIPRKYEVVCGERRYRAMKILEEKAPAQYATIDCNVREMSDDDAFDAMITENLQRQDVDPIEEAFAFGQLVNKGKSVDEIAARFGKSTRFVIDRIKLNSLIPELHLAVKEDRMSISAAMLICKLDAEIQKKYFNSYASYPKGYTKDNAEGFISGYFLRLDHAPWYDTIRDFEGGCNRKCEACEFNTVNHGCLFYEMNAKSEDAQCTNREMYNSKAIAYVKDGVMKYADKLVKKGEPLESGKMVILKVNDWCNDTQKAFKALVHREVENLGFEVVDSTLFESKCYYQEGDERLNEKLESHEVYPCLQVFSYDHVRLEKTYWYVKGIRRSVPTEITEQNTTTAISTQAMQLMEKKHRNIENANAKCATAQRDIAKSMKCCERKGDLSDTEKLAFEALLLINCGSEMLKKYGHEHYGKPMFKDFYKVIKQNRADSNQWIREWMRNIFDSPEVEQSSLISLIANDVLQEWMPDEYSKQIGAIKGAFIKRNEKIIKDLAAIGYDAEGHLLEKQKEPTHIDYFKHYEGMKAKHSGALVLLRSGDRYKTYDADAATLGIILGLKVDTVRENEREHDVTWFDATDLDTYLPKIIKTGTRVALCDTL
jgi:ParB/RepB/Spo0J family partition protein